MNLHGTTIPDDAIADFCHRNGIRRLSLFGSVLRDDFLPESDVDVLVEFHAGKGPSLFRFAGLQIQLGELLGRRVHLNTPAMLGPLYERQVAPFAKVQYAA